MNDEYNTEGPELDDVFEQPVQCSECGKWIELENAYFWTARCECPTWKNCRDGVCEECYKPREDAD